MNCNTTHYRANSSSVPGDPTAERLIQQQDAAATNPAAIQATLPEKGLQLTFHRAVAVDEQADLHLQIRAKPAATGTDNSDIGAPTPPSDTVPPSLLTKLAILLLLTLLIALITRATRPLRAKVPSANFPKSNDI